MSYVPDEDGYSFTNVKNRAASHTGKKNAAFYLFQTQ